MSLAKDLVTAHGKGVECSEVRIVEAETAGEVIAHRVRELEDTYFGWLKRTDEQLRAIFDEYDAKEAASG